MIFAAGENLLEDVPVMVPKKTARKRGLERANDLKASERATARESSKTEHERRRREGR